MWHSEYNQKNYAVRLFAEITKKVNVTNNLFITSPKVEKRIYCTESGKLLSSKCKSVEMGYYATNNMPGICDVH